MREELLPLVGQTVAYLGTMTARETRDDGEGFNICLSQVRVYGDGLWETTALVDAPCIRTDHVWLRRLPPSKIDQKPELLLKYEGLAEVEWYERSDGTTDIGLKTRPGLSADSFYKFLIDAPADWREIQEEVAKVMERHAEGTHPLYSWSWDPREVKQRLQSLNESGQQLLALNDRALKTATNNGPCKKLKAIKVAGRHHKQTTRGFA